MNFFTKSLLLEMPQENLIRRLQGFVILPVSGANAKALLTANGHQKRICALRGGVGALPPLSADSTPSRTAL